MKWITTLAFSTLFPILASCETPKTDMPGAKESAEIPKIPEGSEVVTLGGGCFWCLEAVYGQIEGVHSVTSGYMGGEVENPTYEQVCTGETGHAEVVRVVFDPKIIPFERVLAWFWDMHDPTTLNRQGADRGTQYRSEIFLNNEGQKEIAEASKKAAASLYEDPIVTKISLESTFYPAGDYHQDYYFKNKSAGYCRLVIAPKLKKLKLNH